MQTWNRGAGRLPAQRKGNGNADGLIWSAYAIHVCWNVALFPTKMYVSHIRQTIQKLFSTMSFVALRDWLVQGDTVCCSRAWTLPHFLAPYGRFYGHETKPPLQLGGESETELTVGAFVVFGHQKFCVWDAARLASHPEEVMGWVCWPGETTEEGRRKLGETFQSSRPPRRWKADGIFPCVQHPCQRSPNWGRTGRSSGPRGRPPFCTPTATLKALLQGQQVPWKCVQNHKDASEWKEPGREERTDLHKWSPRRVEKLSFSLLQKSIPSNEESTHKKVSSCSSLLRVSFLLRSSSPLQGPSRPPLPGSWCWPWDQDISRSTCCPNTMPDPRCDTVIGKGLWGHLPLVSTQNETFWMFPTHVNLGTHCNSYIRRQSCHHFHTLLLGTWDGGASRQAELVCSKEAQGGAFASISTSTVPRPVHNAAACTWPPTEMHASVITHLRRQKERHTVHECTYTLPFSPIRIELIKQETQQKPEKEKFLLMYWHLPQSLAYLNRSLYFHNYLVPP